MLAGAATSAAPSSSVEVALLKMFVLVIGVFTMFAPRFFPQL
jgi:hypothetical protein